MALIECPECNKQISDKALTCPGCGNPIKQTAKSIQEERIDIGMLSRAATYEKACALKASMRDNELGQSVYVFKYIIENWPKSEEAKLSINQLLTLGINIETKTTEYNNDNCNLNRIKKNAAAPSYANRTVSSANMKYLYLIIAIIIGGVVCYKIFGIKHQLIRELKKSGENVVDVTDILKINNLNDCYTFNAKYESYGKNETNRYGRDYQRFTVKFQHGEIVRGVADNTGLMSTAIQVCGE